MRQEIMERIMQKQEWLHYLRNEPIWYRLLSRNPDHFGQFERASLHFHKKTLPHHVERVSDSIQLATTLFSLMNAQVSSNSGNAAGDSEAEQKKDQ